MKRYKLNNSALSILLSLVLVFCGCTNDFFSSDDSHSESEVITYLSLSVPGATMVQRARAMLPANENAIKDVKVLVFSTENASSEEVFDYVAPIKDQSLLSENKITVRLRKTQGEKTSRLVLIANAKISSYDFEGKTKEQVLEMLTFPNLSKWDPEGDEEYALLPMWGETTLKSITDNTNFGEVKLLRSLAKIDVGFKFTDLTNGSEVATGLADYDLEEVYLYRSLNKGYVAPQLSTYVGGKVVLPSIPSDAESNGRIDYKDFNDPTKLVRSIYTVENISGDSDNCTSLVVGLRYDGKLSYYRINFVDANNKLISLLRNHRYVVNVTAVNGEGFDNPDTAIESEAANLEWEVSEWDESITDIHVSGNYFLGISNRVVGVEGTMGSVSSLAFQTNMNESEMNFVWTDPSQQDFDFSFDFANKQIVLTAKNDNVSEQTITQTAKLKAGIISVDLTVNQLLKKTAFQIMEETIQVNGKYIRGKALNSSNSITLMLRGVDESIVGHTYEIRTAVINGMSFYASGQFTGSTESITLQPTGTPAEVGNSVLYLESNSSMKQNCNAIITVVYPSKTVLTLGGSATYGYALDAKASQAFVKAPINFGNYANSIVKIDEITIQNILSNETQMESAIATKPDIVLIGYPYSPTARVRTALEAYLRNKGVVIAFNEGDYNATAMKILASLTGNPYTYSTATPDASGSYCYKMTTVNDDIMVGPFGDVRGKYYGEDVTGTRSVGNIPNDGKHIVYVYDKIGGTTNGNVVAFRHTEYSFIYIGDGGVLSCDVTTGMSPAPHRDIMPFRIASDYRPIENTEYDQPVCNSRLFGNIFAWALKEAEFNGINTK